MIQLTQKNNLGDRTEFAKQAIVRYILEMGLTTGDKLPTQAELREQLQIGNATITRAVQSLEADQVVEIRPKIGVFVKDPTVDGYKGWTIGIAVQEFSGHPFTSCMLLYLQRSLYECGCQSLIFYGKETFQRTGFELEWFSGLRRCITARRIDGLITTLEFTEEGWDFLNAHHIPASFVGPVDVPCSTVWYNFTAFAETAIRKVLCQGAQRPAMLSASGIAREYHFPVFSQMTSKLPGFNPHNYYFEGLPRPETGRVIAELLLNLPASKRPDAIISVDDNITIGLTNTLIDRQWNRVEYVPPIMALCNRQLPLLPPWPNIEYYEIDIQEMAENAVDLCLKQLKYPNTEKDVVLLNPQNKKEQLKNEQCLV